VSILRNSASVKNSLIDYLKELPIKTLNFCQFRRQGRLCQTILEESGKILFLLSGPSKNLNKTTRAECSQTDHLHEYPGLVDVLSAESAQEQRRGASPGCVRKAFQAMKNGLLNGTVLSAAIDGETSHHDPGDQHFGRLPSQE
jgi:hypothetical protein